MADRFDRLAEELVSGAQERFVADMSARLAEMLVRGVTNPDMLGTLARVARGAALAVWAEHEREVTEETREAFEEAVGEEDESIVAALSSTGLSVAYDTAYGRAVAAEAARGVAEIVRRQSVSLADSMADAWLRATAEAVTRWESGESRRSVLERAVCELADAGLETIDYASGARVRADAALRRHLVTQANQARNDVLMHRMDEWGHDLVYTTAHFGARPTHAVWQGRVFSRSGSSPDYPPLAESTGYGTAGGLCGVNCLHRMVPYVEGYSQLPDTDFSEQEARLGMTSGEYYEATQRQRRYEAAIRRTKREIAVGEAAGVDMTDRRVLLGRQQARLRQWCRDNKLTRDYGRERAYGVPGAQPRALSASSLSARRAKDAMFEGSFGEATSAARAAYLVSDDLAAAFLERTGMRVEVGRGVGRLARETRAAVMSGIEHGVSLVGGCARNLKFVTTGTLDKGVIAQAERRGDDLVIRISASRVRGRSMDDVEQILFHEVAHAAEWRFTTAQQWEREAARLTSWRNRGSGELKISRSSAIIEEALASSGFRVGYDPLNGLISLGEDAYNEASKISSYAVRDADRGDQDSELMAECIRFAALNGRGANRVADVVVGVLLDGD